MGVGARWSGACLQYIHWGAGMALPCAQASFSCGLRGKYCSGRGCVPEPGLPGSACRCIYRAQGLACAAAEGSARVAPLLTGSWSFTCLRLRAEWKRWAATCATGLVCQVFVAASVGPCWADRGRACGVHS